MQVPGAKDVAVEFFTLSKSYNMPGWRVGFMVGSPKLVGALGRIKSYFDYGTFAPIQIASIAALEGPQDCVAEITSIYKDRRDVLVPGLNKLGWPVELPKATMFAWAKIPEQFSKMGSIEFSKKLLADAKVAVSPGVGFGDHGDSHVRFSLIENEEHTAGPARNQADVQSGLIAERGSVPRFFEHKPRRLKIPTQHHVHTMVHPVVATRRRQRFVRHLSVDAPHAIDLYRV
jgi:aspartate/methionine/tyrosine aminotransferase